MLPLQALALALALNSSAPAQDAAKPLAVYTTFHPTTYFAQRIGGDLVAVTCPLPSGADPAFWQPDRATIEAYQKADVVIVNGAEFEKWVAKASLPAARLVDTAKVFKDQWLTLEDSVTHSHGSEGAHTHKGTDGHVWLDPVLAKAQAAEIHKALVARRPDAKATLDQNFAALAKDLDALDAGYRALGSLPALEWLYASHPAYNYLARRYGWQLHSFHLDPNQTLDVAKHGEVESAKRAKPAHHMLWESQPAPVVSTLLTRTFGLESVVIEPAENVSAEEQKQGRDYLSIQKQNIANLRRCFPARG